MIPAGRAFYKMSGSGNDFVMVDARTEPPGRLAEPRRSQRVCARARASAPTESSSSSRPPRRAVRLIYLNADGSPADFCGNATLCTTRLAVELGIADAGRASRSRPTRASFSARLVDERPEIDLQPVSTSARGRGWHSSREPANGGSASRWSAFRTSSFCATTSRRSTSSAAAGRCVITRRAEGRERQLRRRGTPTAAGGCGRTSEAWRPRRWRAAAGRWPRRSF